FCAYTEITAKMVDDYIERKASTQAIPLENLTGYGTFMKTKIAEKSRQELIEWNARQIYIALGNLLAVCGELEIDACPMEGFEPEKYDEILGLKDKGLTAVLVCPIGYRSEEDFTQHAPKVRKPLAELYETI
ncbi:MAG: nitroreductase family protein, partial [Bacteroidota bacterium]